MYELRICNCGSGMPSYELLDAAGIYVSRVCEACEDSVRSRYAPEIWDRTAYAMRAEEFGESIEAVD